MKYWEIYTTKESIELSGDEKELDKLMAYSFGYGESVASEWDSTLELYVEDGSIYDADAFSFSSSFFIINEKAKKLFDKLAKDDVEYLEFVCKDGNLVIANPITLIDCINMETSKYKVYKEDKDRIQFYEKINFKDGIIGNKNLFRARHLENSVIICSGLFKETIEKNNIKGLGFKYLNECDI